MKLRDCEMCLVYGTDNKPLSRARVESDRNGTIHLYFSNYKLRSVRFQTYVDFYDLQQGLMRTWCELVIRKNSQNSMGEPWMADVEVLEVVDVFQRQADLRVRVHISTEFTTSDGQFFTGTIKNISAGGIFVVTSQAIAVGVRASFSHRFDGEMLNLRAKILRVKKSVSGGFGYGCQFFDLTPEAETTIRKFVFSKQMEKLKKPEGAR